MAPRSTNVAEDYHKAFGRAPAWVKGIRRQISSKLISSSAESYFVASLGRSGRGASKD
jgi:hypothetical protein